jgi:methylmalonyl-CoA/ethylmalonyl-CoA epimerase
MIKRILEIGVAVNDIKTTGSKLHDILGAQAGMIIKDDGYGMVAQMFRVGNIEFELMEPAHQNGIIAKFLKSQGEGLHHVAFEVGDIVKNIEWIKQKNIRLINETPISIYGCKAIFLHPEPFGGVLIELIEGIPKWVNDCALPTELQEPIQPQGIGAEGILEVGIIVQDLEAMSIVYSVVLLSKASEIVKLESPLLRAKVYRAGNVNLKMIEMLKKENSLNVLSGRDRLGLRHVTLKVSNIRNAIAYLKSKRINFTENPPAAIDDSKSVLICPKEISGIPIFLKEESQEGAPTL